MTKSLMPDAVIYFLDLAALSTVIVSSINLCFLVLEVLEVSVIISDAERFKLNATKIVVDSMIFFIEISFIAFYTRYMVLYKVKYLLFK